MANTVEQIKNRLSAVDVISSYLKLEKAGINFKSKCPFHNEKTPSFFVSPDRNSYYCFGCGRKGDILNFVQEFEGVDFFGSLKILADRAGIEISNIGLEKKDENQKILSIMERATTFYEGELEKSLSARTYLKGRGLQDETIKAFRLGFAPESWSRVLDLLKSEGYLEKDIEKAGLIKKGEDGRYYDRFRGRVMFVVNDPSGRPIAFSGRILKDDDKSAKYINSPETAIFRKSDCLFLYDKAKFDIRKKDFAILVEGNLDAMLAHQVGYRNTVAPLGTSLTKEQLIKISRLTNKLVIAFDSDKAGFKASKRGAQTALSMGIDLKVATMPKGLDPADLILAELDGWKKAIRESKHIVDFSLERLKHESPDKRKLGLRIKEEILPFVVMIENKIDQAYFVKNLAEVMGISEGAVYEELTKVDLKDLQPSAPDDVGSNIKESEKRVGILHKIFGIINWQESLKEPIVDVGLMKKELERITSKTFFELMPEKLDDITLETSILYENEKEVREELEELLQRFEEDLLQAEFTDKMRLLRQAEDSKDSVKSIQYLNECQNLSKKLNAIRAKHSHY